MNHRTRLAVSLLVLAMACGPGSDVNGFPSALANAYCHFAYHCCTPIERQTFPQGFSNLATTLDFDSEGDCDSKYGEQLQASAQTYQASVKDKRITWNSTAAQACLNALNNAANSCSAQAFAVALSGDPNNPGTPAACDTTQFITGDVASGGACTIDQDCSGQGSTCKPAPQNPPPTVITTGGTCAVLPPTGQPCANGQCATGNCCDNTNTCVQYVATGSTCGGFFCASGMTCDPTIDYCGGNGTCTQKIANGQPCFNNDPLSCQSDNCNAGNCAAVQGQQVSYNICTGNKDGL